MNKEKNTQTLIIAILAVAILVMAAGFAGYNANLNITGNTTLSAASWNVHFVEGTTATGHFTETTGSGYVSGITPTISGTNVTYSVTLPNPGDKYEFTIDVINEGTFDAKLNSIVLAPTLTEDELKNLAVTITYDGTAYTADTTHGTWTVADKTLSKKISETPGRHTVKVTTEYKKVTNDADLLEENMTKALSITFNYTSIDPTPVNNG